MREVEIRSVGARCPSGTNSRHTARIQGARGGRLGAGGGEPRPLKGQRLRVDENFRDRAHVPSDGYKSSALPKSCLRTSHGLDGSRGRRRRESTMAGSRKMRKEVLLALSSTIPEGRRRLPPTPSAVHRLPATPSSDDRLITGPSRRPDARYALASSQATLHP